MMRDQFIEDLIHVFEERNTRYKLSIIIQMAFWYCLVYSPYTVLSSMLSTAICLYALHHIYPRVFGDNADSTCFATGLLVSPIILILTMGIRACLLIILCADTTFVIAGWKEEELLFYRLTHYLLKSIYLNMAKTIYLNMYRKPTKEEEDDIKSD